MTRVVSPRARIGLAAAFATVIAAVSVVPAHADDGDGNPYTGDPTAIAEGQRLWADTGCYSCHGENADGAVGPDLTDDVWVYNSSDATLFKAIALGRRGTNMVAWGNELDPDQIWKVIAWLRSLYRGDPKKVNW